MTGDLRGKTAFPAALGLSQEPGTSAPTHALSDKLINVYGVNSILPQASLGSARPEHWYMDDVFVQGAHSL